MRLHVSLDLQEACLRPWAYDPGSVCGVCQPSVYGRVQDQCSRCVCVCVCVIRTNRPDNLLIQPCSAKGVCLRVCVCVCQTLSYLGRLSQTGEGVEQSADEHKAQ